MMSSALHMTTLLVVAIAIASGVYSIPTVTRTGRYLYTSDGNRFYIKGVAYQEQGVVIASETNAFLEPSSFIDPLANGTACTRDIPFLKQLGVNTIRVYSVNSSLNHDDCMHTFSDNGIYTIIDLSLPVNGSIVRTAASWSTNLLNLYIDTIDAFSAYDNVLAYNIGNEVVIDPNGTDVSAFVKAAARDTKAYLLSKNSPALVGYAAIDGDATWIDPLANYLSCDPSNTNSGSSAIDLYGLNDYQWCGDSTFESSYAGTQGQFAGYNVAAYFSEFGCITSPPRLWTEVGALFSDLMSDVWSGGLAFSYFPATSAQGQFGMVDISPDGTTVTPNADFTALATQYGLVAPPNTPAQSGAGTPTYPTCPQTNTSFLASTTLPPTPNDAACTCLSSTLSCLFTPQTTNFTEVVGELLDTACGLLGQAGGNCDDIAANGATGVYGRVSGCDPTVKLSFVFSEYYESQQRKVEACSFAGNGTVNPNAPTTVSAANSAASSCISNPSAIFTPTTPASSTPSPSESSAQKSGALITAFADVKVLMGLGITVAVGVGSAIWTLAPVL